MKLTKKQQQTIIVVEYFIPESITGNFPLDRLQNYKGDFKLNDIEEDKNGISAEEAFFMKTERGKLPKTVSDMRRFIQLLWGQRHMAMHEKMYRIEFSHGRLFLQEFANDPEPVQKFVENIYKKVEKEHMLSVLLKTKPN